MRSSTVRRATALACAIGAVGVVASLAHLARAADTSATAAPGWDRRAAARYLDSREVWWQAWDRTHKDRATYCVSCHTQAPYALARPGLRQDLGERDLGPAEKVMLASVDKRVRQWAQMQPFYSDVISGPGKEVESRNAESVLNAFMLTSYDVRRGHLSDTARLAFDNAWALQSTSGPDAGAWVWQNFHYAPWESPESQYHWAALMALAVGRAPDGYRNDPKIQPNLAALTGYLRSHYEAQPLLNKVVALWASSAFPDLLTPVQRAALIEELRRAQHPDGGWSLSDLGPWKKRVDDTPQQTASDGYATAVVVLTLEETAAAGATAPTVSRGRGWLLANQDRTTGAWQAWSLNKNRDPKSDPGPFMADAATAYAVLALDAGH
jgi:squalene-hopene/tetraprenyl-beta-curcumene cyclase